MSTSSNNINNFMEKMNLNFGHVYRNLPIPILVEHVLKNKEGVLGEKGEIICRSGKYTGRTPKDKFFVDEDSTRDTIWWGGINQKIPEKSFDILLDDIRNKLQGKDMYVFDGFAGASEANQIKVRIITMKAWHAHFVTNMFIRPRPEDLDNFEPDFTIINACELTAGDKWESLGLNSETFAIFNLAKKTAIIGGTEYAGEMKKGIFSVLNYQLPFKDVMPMHCSANKNNKGEVSLFFGLSGTGKTTLSTDENCYLIGDDEHGWSDEGVFNFEGGCYAKTINLSKEKEPGIWNSIKFGAILENVVYDEQTRKVNFSDSSITENTRVSYPIYHIDKIEPSGCGAHPKYIIFLTCDAFGVMPPVAKLTPEQASYHFLSGYTAKVAGTELGVNEPTSTFSTCFGAAFMVRYPEVYADLLSKKMKQHNTKAFLVNTGWFAGSYSQSSRIDIKTTRGIIHNISNGAIDKCSFKKDFVFGYEIPITLGDIPRELLDQRSAWSDPNEYDKQRMKLANMFVDNFKQFEEHASHLKPFGPKLS